MKIFAAVAMAAVGFAPAWALDSSGGWKFHFGTSPKLGFVQVSAAGGDKGGGEYGFLSAPEGEGTATGLVSEKPFGFFVNLPEGNYRVRVVLAAGEKPASTTIKVESRRLMVEKAEVAPGGKVVREFTVNVRTPKLPDGRTVGLKPGELGPPLSPRWDDRLTFEFLGENPSVSEIEITPEPSAVTVFIAGDSTATEQGREPWAGWGQMLSSFFGPGVAVANHAESGLALFSFRGQRRLDKILASLKPGDYVFVQFGHNDQKDKSPHAGPFTTYQDNLKAYVAAIRKKGGLPVLVTPMERRRWKGSEIGTTLGDYAEAVRQVGAAENVPVIDLHAMSITLYKALGPEGSKKAFVFFPPNTFPGQEKALADNTHHSNYGGYELARCMVEGIRAKIPPLAAFLRKEVPAFDPARPDAPEKFTLPASPATKVETPAGS